MEEWQKCTDFNGQPFYFNIRTQQVVAELPAGVNEEDGSVGQLLATTPMPPALTLPGDDLPPALPEPPDWRLAAPVADWEAAIESLSPKAAAARARSASPGGADILQSMDWRQEAQTLARWAGARRGGSGA